MMNTTQINSNQIYSPSASQASGSQAMGKDEFLKLLVAQLKNQNPLSPAEGQEFASQLAQFSSVEQLTEINSNIQGSAKSDLILTQAVNNTLATNFIGKEVTSLGDTVSLVSGDSPSVSFSLSDYAADVTVKIYDETGNLVRTLNAAGLDAGMQSLQWDGKDEDGNLLPGGNYRFEAEAKGADDEALTVTELTKGIVSTIRYDNGQAVLIVNGKQIALADVLEIGK